ncbi:hypothetical protein [Undibacterium parvum]|uniref:hypothetical protein n=1 Tax=Undibacterium parvum TaxID=401471 RepID=UPI0018814EBF|nr:hypothetical protein [Undibacterium parvum]
MKKLIQLISIATLATSILAIATQAQANPTPTKTKSTKTTKAATPAVVDEDEAEPNVQMSKSFEYKCELGNTLTMYTNVDDQQHVGMRWKHRIYRMTRMETSTGANRFENTKAGFVFIGIPAKGLLLDSRRGQQLANECKTTDPTLAEALNVSDAPIPRVN